MIWATIGFSMRNWWEGPMFGEHMMKLNIKNILNFLNNDTHVDKRGYLLKKGEVNSFTPIFRMKVSILIESYLNVLYGTLKISQEHWNHSFKTYTCSGEQRLAEEMVHAERKHVVLLPQPPRYRTNWAHRPRGLLNKLMLHWQHNLFHYLPVWGIPDLQSVCGWWRVLYSLGKLPTAFQLQLFESTSWSHAWTGQWFVCSRASFDIEYILPLVQI